MINIQLYHNFKLPLYIVRATHTSTHIRTQIRSVDMVIIKAYDYHGPWEYKLGHHSPLTKRASDNEKEAEYNVVSIMHSIII